ncbi:YadA-like family protein [Aquabacterium sp.]|uniref:beta strand repeat-containing protein n=1 Tax=Aquabacterium sp. TaxID=1872578 RepID=UPI002633062B|nr:YadA-like family protein [Aquabacterium sp.]
MSAVHTFPLKHAALAASLCFLGTAAMAQAAITENANVVITGNSDNNTGGAAYEGVFLRSNLTSPKAYVEVVGSDSRGDINMAATSIRITGATGIAGNTNIDGTLTTTNNASLGGALSVTGASTLSGATSLGNTLSVAGASTLNGATSVKSTLTVDGASTLSGATTVDNTLLVTGASTLSNTLSVNSGDGVEELAVGTNSVTALGVTSINTTGAGATTIGANGNTTTLSSNTINVGTGAYTTAVTLGSTQGGTVVTASGGNSSVQVLNGRASLTSGTAGYNSYATAQTVGTDYTLKNGNTASQAIVTGAAVDNIITGNTLVDGNMYINGTLVYSSNTSATTNVVNSDKNTSAAMTIVNSGQQGAVIDANGKIGAGTATSSTASLTVTNQAGNTHGLVVNESQATLSGGTQSSSLTLDDRGATFSNSATGAPVTVTGVADGRNDFDAVNVRQYASAIAGVAAAANIPAPEAGKTSSVGVGLGNFMGKTALALGFNHRLSATSLIKASVASGTGRGSKPIVGVGAGWSW